MFPVTSTSRVKVRLPLDHKRRVVNNLLDPAPIASVSCGPPNRFNRIIRGPVLDLQFPKSVATIVVSGNGGKTSAHVFYFRDLQKEAGKFVNARLQFVNLL